MHKIFLILYNSCIPPQGVFVMANKVIVLPPRSQESRLENDRRPHETRSPIKTRTSHAQNLSTSGKLQNWKGIYVTCHIMQLLPKSN